MITIPGQLAIKTIHGRNGDFNVGRLATSIGEFVVKNAELDQYAEGKYEGDFAIAEIRPSTYSANGRMVIEIRALLGGMTLSNIDALSRDDALRDTPIRLVDERLTTVDAHRGLHSSGLPGRAHRRVVDQAAAVLILQAALDRERGSGEPLGELFAGPPARKPRRKERRR